MELLEIADLLAALYHDLLDVLDGHTAVYHHNDHMVQQVVYLVCKLVLVAVLCVPNWRL